MKWTMLMFVLVAAGPVASQDKASEKRPARQQEVVSQPAKPERPPEASVGFQAPSFGLKDSNGLYQRLADRQGSPVLLVFFRTDCKPCLRVMSKISDFHVKYGHEVQVLLVALLEEQDGRARLDEYLSRLRPSFPVLVDPKEEVAADYVIKADMITLPTLFFIDAEGVITSKVHRPTRPLQSYLED